MGRAPCCDKANVKRGPWSPEEDAKLKEFIDNYGTGGNWIALPQKAGLKRCGKSCRLRWLNYLRPNIKHGEFSDDEDRVICSLYASIGSRWSIIAAQLPGRTDNDIKNYWNTKLKKKLMGMIIPTTQRKLTPFPSPLQSPPLQSPSLYRENCCSYYTPIDFEPISIPPNYLLNNTTSTSLLPTTYSLLQNQETLWSPMQYYSVKEGLLMFGGDQTSCSSSDGTCSQISYGNGKEIKQEDMGGFQGNYTPNGFEENQQFMVNYGSNGGYFGNSSTPLQYDPEEVKQLINNNSYLLNDENKTHEREDMYFY